MSNAWLYHRLKPERIRAHEQERWKSLVARVCPLTEVDPSTKNPLHGPQDRTDPDRPGITEDHRDKHIAVARKRGEGRGRASAHVDEEAVRGNVGALPEAPTEEWQMSSGEGELAALALALIGDTRTLTSAEAAISKRKRSPAPDVIAAVRARISAGEDVLGDRFCLVRSAGERRTRGAIFTPPAIVEAMIAWAKTEHDPPARIVDPGAGSGRFLIAAASAFPQAQLIGVEIDPIATLMLRANAAVHGFAARLTVEVLDYRQINFEPIEGRTLFVGNPPYVRHQ